MLDKLRKKLTLLCALITTAILIIITMIAFSLLNSALNNRNQLALLNEVTTVSQHIQSEAYISHTWLAQQETNEHCVISITTPNSSLLFPGAYPTLTDRKVLIEKARAIGHSKYHFDVFSGYFFSSDNHTVTFPLRTSSEHFLVSITAITYNSHPYELIILKDMASSDAEIFRLKLIFVGLVACGILLLSLFSWWFAGNAIEPIKVSQQEQIDFVAAASHELRSPVAVIQSTTDIMLQNRNEPDKQGLTTIRNECHHLSRLINDLLLLARADSGKWSINKEATHIDNLLLEVYDQFLPLVEAHQQKLYLQLPDDVISPLLLDKQRINQVLFILLDNAMSYTPVGTQITLTLEAISDKVEIGVIDNGPGIPDEAKKNVFKRFCRLDAARKSDDHYGLGLNIAYEILKLHDSKLILTDSPNGGCTFKFALSVDKASAKKIN